MKSRSAIESHIFLLEGVIAPDVLPPLLTAIHGPQLVDRRWCFLDLLPSIRLSTMQVKGILALLLTFSILGDCRRRRYKECSEERLKVREGAADVIVTGSVKRLYGDGKSGEVLVKRVLKGDYIQAGETLLVEGFGKQDICSSQAAAKDSKIFLLSQLQSGTFRLNSSMIQINTHNLDQITATVKGIPYRRRQLVAEEPCEKKYCQFNGDCSEENRRAVCRCPTSCKEHYNPVCGNDAFTYNTECQMRVDSCRKKKRIYVRHEGLCLHSTTSI